MGCEYQKVLVVLLVIISGISGCVGSGARNTDDQMEESGVIVGFMQLEPNGPFFRRHQAEAEVRFFDIIHTETGERIRVEGPSNGEAIVRFLVPGTYSLFRLQIGEGPFRSETGLEMTFQVYPDTVTYLGLWRIRVDPPKTVRMIQMDVFAEAPDWDPFLESYPDLRGRPMVLELLQPQRIQERLFAVAPVQPRSKYFYRR